MILLQEAMAGGYFQIVALIIICLVGIPFLTVKIKKYLDSANPTDLKQLKDDESVKSVQTGPIFRYGCSFSLAIILTTLIFILLLGTCSIVYG